MRLKYSGGATVQQSYVYCSLINLGLVAVGFQEQAEDILVPPLLRNCLTLNYIFPLVIISPPEQWSLQ